MVEGNTFCSGGTRAIRQERKLGGVFVYPGNGGALPDQIRQPDRQLQESARISLPVVAATEAPGRETLGKRKLRRMIRNTSIMPVINTNKHVPDIWLRSTMTSLYQMNRVTTIFTEFFCNLRAA